MGGRSAVRHYFAEGLTLRGYISLLPNMTPLWQRAYVLLGGPGTGKSTLIKRIGLELLDRGCEVDFLRAARDPDSMAGFLLPRQKVGMLDAMEVSPLQWRAPGVVEDFIDLTAFVEVHRLSRRREAILRLQERIEEAQRGVEEALRAEFEGWLPGRGRIWPKPEDIRGGAGKGLAKPGNSGGSWPQAAQALQHLQRSVLQPCFLHGLSSEGWLNLAPHFLGDCDQIHLETEGSAEALDWLLNEACSLGQVIDMILHPLNPDEIIGIVFPERRLAIWQGDPQHPSEQGLGDGFGETLKAALQSWHELQGHLQDIYREAVDFSQVDQLRTDLTNRLLRGLDVTNSC